MTSAAALARFNRARRSPRRAFDWVYEKLGSDMWLSSVSGGTDIAGRVLGGSPIVPVYRGELQARYLGRRRASLGRERSAGVDEVGELVVTQPMPSMPVKFWDDPDDSRYRDAYFSTYPGVWRHGDWIRITPEGSAIVYGRSDSTINRGGIRSVPPRSTPPCSPSRDTRCARGRRTERGRHR